MELTILFSVFTVLMLVGTPIAFCLGISSFVTVVYMGLPPLVVFQRVASGVSVFTLMAIPFFIFAGDLMVRGGIAARIVSFAGALIGHVRGGLGQVNIAASTLFGGISGSAVAEAAAVGGIMIPQMKARGYGADYAVNVTSMAALMVPLDGGRISPQLPPVKNDACSSKKRTQRSTSARVGPRAGRNPDAASMTPPPGARHNSQSNL